MPTRPGIPQKSLCISAYESSVATEHGDQSKYLVPSGSSEPVVHGNNKLFDPVDDFDGVEDVNNGDGVVVDEVVSKDTDYSLECLREDDHNFSSLLEESYNLTFTELTSSSRSDYGASLSLDYNPSSHDDDSDEEEVSARQPSYLNHPATSTPLVAKHYKANIDLSVAQKAPSPLARGQQHEPGTLGNLHYREHEECRPQGNDAVPDLMLSATLLSPGNCLGCWYNLLCLYLG